MGQILRDIYTDISISSLLGFKGGSCAYFFYDLPRFSVDLDFDLLRSDEKTQDLVFESLKNIASRYGEIRDAYIKRYTIFLLLSYGESDHNIKMEVNTRILVPDIYVHYKAKDYLGIPVLAGKPDYLFAGKLVALTSRTEIAMRDVYDVWFFAKNNWPISDEVIKERVGRTIPEHLAECIEVIQSIKDKHMLTGLGELVDDKTKDRVKNSLKQETVFLLKNYHSALL